MMNVRFIFEPTSYFVMSFTILYLKDFKKVRNWRTKLKSEHIAGSIQIPLLFGGGEYFCPNILVPSSLTHRTEETEYFICTWL